MKLGLHLVGFFLLAIVTQVGAVTYGMSLLLLYLFKLKNKLFAVLMNVALYVMVSFAVVPWLAPLFGREPITVNDNLQPVNHWLIVGLNRNYVLPELNQFLQRLCNEFEKNRLSRLFIF